MTANDDEPTTTAPGDEPSGEQAGGPPERSRRPDSWSELPDWFGRRWSEVFGARGEFMRIEEVDEPGALVVRAELPGVDPDGDVEITIDQGRLTISAERRDSSITEEGGRKRSEFRYGASSRTIGLPPGAAGDQVSATYADGILEVRIPVDPEAGRTTRVPVRRH